jgi:hypothetical protein
MSRSLHARLAELYAELAAVHAKLAREAGAEYVDQNQSPLGARLHCRLARSGTLPSYKAGRRILVRAADIDAYLETQKVEITEAPAQRNEFDVLLEQAARKSRRAA